MQSGGGGTVPGEACSPETVQPCYSGPAGTELVGLCMPGTQTCLADGTGFGACENETVPSLETCSNPGDEDCDGETNEDGIDCFCVPGWEVPCYSADPATENVGLCVPGLQVCNTEGTGFGPCVGEVTPTAESCLTAEDDDCDGDTDDDDANCVCPPNSIIPCYSGPPGTQGIGPCTAGTQVCDADGMGFSPCVGEVIPSPDHCSTAADDDCDGSVQPLCPGGDHLWSKRFGGTGTEWANDVAVDASGNVVVVGRARGDLDFGGGPLPAVGQDDIFIAKLDPTGNHLWSKRFGNNSPQEALAVATDPLGNVFVGGRFTGTLNFGGAALTAPSDDMFLIKFDPAGNHLWSKKFGNIGADYASEIVADSNGNVVVSGAFDYGVNFGGGTLTGLGAMFIAKFAPDGSHIWSKAFDGTGFQGASGLAVDASGNVAVGGFFQGTLDLGGGPLQAAGGALDDDAFLAKFDSNGDHLWSQRFGDVLYQGLHDLAVTTAGEIVLVGNFDGTIDFGGGPLMALGADWASYVAKIDGDGSHQWSHAFSSGNTAVVFDVVVDPNEDITIAGAFDLTIDLGGGPLVSAGALDCLVAKLDAMGNHKWSHRFGATGHQIGLAVAANAAGDVFVGGHFYVEVDFGGGPLVSVADDDGFLAKLSL